MEYVNLGHTGLKVSRLCVGCMSFGTSDHGVAGAWSLGEEESRKIIKHVLDLGINFFDTANVYSEGTSEEILGKALKDYANRDEIVVASKVYFPMSEGPNAKGLSRKAIFREIDATLKRLKMDYLDLYIIHRWDYTTPIEETMEALNDLVKMGKVRYIGASSMYAWQFAKAQQVAKEHGWVQFVSMQNLYNLIYREEEREMIPLLQDQKIAMTPWSPLAKGRLARAPGEKTKRTENDPVANRFFPQNEVDGLIIERVGEIAKKHGVSRAQVAMAWVLSKPYVTSALIGSSKIHHLDDAVAALNLKLTEEEMSYLEEAYVPHVVVGI